MTYEQDRAAREQDGTEAMIRMRDPTQDIRRRHSTGPHPTPERRVIQMTATQVMEGAITQCEAYIFALCDDGTMWRCDNRNWQWVRMPAVPTEDVP